MNPRIHHHLRRAAPPGGSSRAGFRPLWALLALLLALPARAQDIQVAPPGGNVPGALDLMAAVKTAPEGSLIGLAPGTYDLVP
jgi:hypothetical protein